MENLRISAAGMLDLILFSSATMILIDSCFSILGVQMPAIKFSFDLHDCQHSPAQFLYTEVPVAAVYPLQFEACSYLFRRKLILHAAK